MSLVHNHPTNVSTTACEACLKEGAKHQERAQRGFSVEDVWSFDCYLAGVIAGGCRELARISHGAPTSCYANPDAIEQATKADSDEAMECWKGILEDIARGFEGYAINDTPTPEFHRAFTLLRKHWGDLWD